MRIAPCIYIYKVAGSTPSNLDEPIPSTGSESTENLFVSREADAAHGASGGDER